MMNKLTLRNAKALLVGVIISSLYRVVDFLTTLYDNEGSHPLVHQIILILKLICFLQLLDLGSFVAVKLHLFF